MIPWIPFDRNAGEPFYTQIYRGLREAIVTGRLSAGQRIPSSRVLAAELKISRVPVLIAFEHLIDEGYIQGRIGSGMYVAESVPDELDTPIRWLRLDASEQSVPSPPPNGIEGHRLGLFGLSLPAVDHFPREAFARLVRRHTTAMPKQVLACGDPAGYYPLRKAVAAYLRSTRAVDCDPGQVLIVSGSTMGIRLSAMALTTSDAIICVEEPGNWRAAQILRASNATVAPVAVDDEGIDVASVRRLGNGVKLVHVTPSHEYPLGMSMSVPRRLELLDWARRSDAWILEDDNDSEFRSSRRLLSSLQGMDATGHVVYLGSFSKVLFPALRLGYIVVPTTLVDEFIRIRTTIDFSPPTLFQHVLTDFFNEGHLARHVRRMRGIYHTRRAALVDAIQQEAADVLFVTPTDAGLHLVAVLPPGVDDRAVVRRAEEHGMSPSALSECYATQPARSGLLLGFAGTDEHLMRNAARDLGNVIREMT